MFALKVHEKARQDCVLSRQGRDASISRAHDGRIGPLKGHGRRRVPAYGLRATVTRTTTEVRARAFGMAMVT